jgi:proline dehydrogenase
LYFLSTKEPFAETTTMSIRRAASLLQQCQQHLPRTPAPLPLVAAASLHRPFSQQQAAPTPTATPPTPPTTPANEAPLPNLDDPSAFAARTTPELLRAYLVLRLCLVKPLVRNAEPLLRLSRRLLGDRLTDALVGKTFFAHFCAGVDGDAIQPVIARLRAANVQSIVDYAAEDDVDPTAAAAAASAAPSSSSSSPSYVHPRGEAVVGRTYDYADETACDGHVSTFLSAIDAVGREKDSRGDGGFAAIKITALGNPLLLERMTSALATVRRLFSAADSAGTGRVDLPAFTRLYQVLFPHAPADRAERAFAELVSRSSRSRGGGGGAAAADGQSVDLVDWCLAIRLQDMPAIAARIARHHKDGGGGGSVAGGLAGEVEHSALDEEEVRLAEAMLGRVAVLAERAAERRVRLMVDAEHTYFQGAIDHTAKQLMGRYNGRHRGGGFSSSSSSAAAAASSPAPPPVVFNTYQCYLKDSRQRLEEDLELARRRGYRFAAKLGGSR